MTHFSFLVSNHRNKWQTRLTDPLAPSLSKERNVKPPLFLPQGTGQLIKFQSIKTNQNIDAADKRTKYIGTHRRAPAAREGG
jgi:hypothetical protein